ncbi:MAG: hypothetical protein GX595_17975, partial [Lentisphaerae bacterium]|nr:hypothetical protein [Lentisphaerota bacterium]
IVEAMENGALERTPVLEEYAAQYAELCLDIVTRLQRCADYLERGMRSEAVHEATSPPALLDLVEVVRFPELRKWGNVVVDLDLTSFPQIPMEIVERLRQECATEEGLAPLLKEYRRLVYQGDRANSIRVLRELRQRDPLNPSWPQNLKPLEEATLPGILREVDAALAAQDRRRLRELDQELRHPQRAAPVPAEVLSRVSDALLAERRASTRLAATEIAQRLRAALGRDDPSGLAEGLAAWDALAAEEGFDPDARARATADEARASHAAWTQEQAAAAAFAAGLDELRGLLRQERPAEAAIRQHLEALRQTGRSVPDEVRDAVREALAAGVRRRARRRRLAGAVVAAAVLVILAGTGVTLWRLQVARSRRLLLTEMSAQLEAREFDRLKAALEALRQRDPAFYGSAEVRHLATSTEEALRRKADLDRQFQAAMAQLSRLRDGGYQASDEAIQALLAEARQVAPDEPADRAVGAWQQSWDDWRRRRRAEAEDHLNRTIALARRWLDERRQRPFPTFADEERALAQVEPAWREAGTALAGAGTEVATAFTAVGVELDAWRRDLDQRRGSAREAEERQQALRTEIARALPDLRHYRTLLEQFVRDFPSAAEVPAYQRVLNHLDAWTRVEALSAFQLPRLPPGRDGERRLRETAAAELVQGSVWEADLKAAVTCLDLNEAARQRLPSLAVTTDDSLRLLVTRYRAVGSEAWRSLYHPKPLLSRKDTDAQGEFILYWGQVYYSEADDHIPVLMHTSKAFPTGLSTRLYEIRQEARLQDNLVPQARWLYSFVAEGAEAEEVDVHLLHGIEAALGEPGLEPVPRAWLVKRLVHLLADVFGDRLPESRVWAEHLRDLETDVPWMNPRHPAVVAAAERILPALAEFPAVAPAVTRAQVGRAVLAASLSRQVACVGWLQRRPDGALVPSFLAAGEGPVWVLSVGNPGVPPSFLVAGTRLADGTMVAKPGLERELFEGQVLFAPRDGKASRDLAAGLIPRELREQVPRPASWPSNDWVTN